MVGAGFSVELLTKEKNKIELLLKKCTDALEIEQKPIILFGSGVIGRFYLGYIKKIDIIQQVYFCDNNPAKWGCTIEGIPVISFDELKYKFSNSYIILSTLAFVDEMINQLKQNNLYQNLIDPSVHAKITDMYCYSNFQDYRTIITENQFEFENVYHLLSDDTSKRIFIDRLNYCISVNPAYLMPLKSSSPQYFEPGIIELSNDEIFIDGGAFTGDTVDEFIRQTNGVFQKVYSFEPEKTKHNDFLSKFLARKNIELVKFGLWSQKKILRFDAQDSSASALCDHGNMDIPVISIDEYLNGAPATFIKMDIEGAELEALKGAEKTIRTHKPKLAICIYHKPLDIVEIPLYLKKLIPEYKLYLRHYGDNVCETICYAVCK